MAEPIIFAVKTFDSLSLTELYAILQLRSAVFVVEQNCVYQDIDGKDDSALHVMGSVNGKIVAYTRLFDKGIYFDQHPSIGRVVIANSARKSGYGHLLMKTSLAAVKKNYGNATLKISAQTYLTHFYEQHGFEARGTTYLEDGIPHVAMYCIP